MVKQALLDTIPFEIMTIHFFIAATIVTLFLILLRPWPRRTRTLRSCDTAHYQQTLSCTEGTMKTYEQWGESNLNLGKFLQVGDEVDQAMVDYAINVLPPATFKTNLVQIGEPNSHVDGKATWATFQKRDGKWYWRGHCFRNCFLEPYPIPHVTPTAV